VAKRKMGPSNSQRTAPVSVAGFKRRPLAIPVVEQRLGAVLDIEKRGSLALYLAETCYECFSVENLHCDPADDDGILTSLVDLDLQLDHIGWHIRTLKKPLKDVIKALDSKLAKQEDKERGRR